MLNITIKGKEYPAMYSLRAAIRTAEKYGSVESIFESEGEAQNLQQRIWLLHEMMVAGKLYAEKDEGRETPEVPSYDDLLDSIDFVDAGELAVTLLSVITNSQTQQVEVKPSKNSEATLAQ